MEEKEKPTKYGRRASKKRRVPQQKEISKERRVCDIICKKKKEGFKRQRSILEQDFDSAQTRKGAAQS